MELFFDRFNLEKQVTFYLSYHSNKINQYIHLVCIWPVFVSGLVLLANTQPLIELPQFLNSLPFGQYMIPNYSAVVVSIYMFWYIALDRVAGTFGAIIVFLCYVLANFLVVEGVTFMKASIAHVALAIIVLGFILQFIGHGVFEHRKPALFDGPGQALITAPMFVLLEIMFSLGYRPELHQRIVKQMQKNIRNSSSLKTI